MKLLALLAYARKAVVQLVGGEIGWAAVSLQHGFGGVSFDQWIAQTVLIATAFGVYIAPNAELPTPPAKG